MGKQINNIYEEMNKLLNILADWYSAKKLSLNLSKSKCMADLVHIYHLKELWIHTSGHGYWKDI